MVGQKTEQGGEIFNYYPDTYNTGNAAGNYAHAEGNYTKANGAYSHAEGNNTIASGESSHAEGYGTTSLGNRSHAEGNYTKANGAYSHAEGDNTEASGESSHAEGNMTIASENYAHAEGSKTIASGYSSHAEGSGTKASATGAHAEGSDTIASGFDSHVQGRSNIDDVDADGNALNTYAHIVGNGSTNIRSNAHTLDWSGNAWYSGDVYVGSTSGVNKDKGSKKLATEEYVDTSIANLVDSAPEELNTLNELAVAMKENSDVVDALNSAITNKADEDHNHNNIYYTQEQVDAMELITIADIDEICGGITEGSLLESDVDELMARLQQ